MEVELDRGLDRRVTLAVAGRRVHEERPALPQLAVGLVDVAEQVDLKARREALDGHQRYGQPTRVSAPPNVASRIPCGGPWVIRTSVSDGIAAHVLRANAPSSSCGKL